MARMRTGMPAQKVTVSAVAAAATTVILGVLPASFATLRQFQAEVVVIVTFLVGYYTPPSPNDGVVATSGEAAGS